MAGADLSRSWVGRSARVARLGARVGGTYAGTAARKVFASTERRIELDERRRLTTGQQVADELGRMKGALMKLGQMASYLDEGLPEPLRLALAQLQSNAPPMSSNLVDSVITAELGAILRQGFGGLDPTEMVNEIKERLSEELDYRREADNQRRFADFYRGHPRIHIPDVVDHLSTARVLTTDLVDGHTWAELLTWDEHERDLAAETIFRFVFRSLYTMRAFNGDPHPGNYLFHGDGRVTFLDFGLVKEFSEAEMHTFETMVRLAAVEHDVPAFRAILEEAGMLLPDAPVDTDEVGDYFSHFYEPVSADREMTWTPSYASSIVRHTFDRSSPISQYATVPRAFVFIQRINLGLYALLGELGARGNYRRLAEELWPFTQHPPSTPLGEDEAAWLDERHIRSR